MERKTVTLRLAAETLAKAKHNAADTHRSLNGYLVHLIEEDAKRRRDKVKP